MSRKKLTVYDYLQCKGKRQLSVMFVHNADEAAAAEEAGIDMICTSHDAPQFGIFNSFDELKRIREAAPTCFMQSGVNCKSGNINCFIALNNFTIMINQY